MQFNPESKRPNYLLPKGVYQATIEAAEEKTSKKGNPMLVVELRVWDGERSKVITDYIVSGGEFAMDWKIGHLVKALGDDPTAGKVDPAALVGRNVTVKVKIKPPKGEYGEDNAIDDYLEVVKDGEIKGVSPAGDPPF